MHYVLTACCGYPLKVYQRFVATLYRSGFRGKAVLFVLATDLATIQPLLREYPDVEHVVMRPTCQLDIHRYAAMRAYLLQVDATSVDTVLLTDSRDVLFQRDFTAHPLVVEGAHDLLLFAEGNTIGNCRFNTRWIQIVASNVLPALADKPILCSGTTLGSYRGIFQYLDALLAVAAQLIGTGRAGAVGLDQGIHNFIYYMNKLPNLSVRVLTNDDNLVNTLGYAYKGLDNDGRIVNRSGEVSYVCHQYDRFEPAMLAELEASLAV